MNILSLTTKAEIQNLIEWHNANSEYVVLDIETTGLDPLKDRIIDVQISAKSADEVAIFSGEYVLLLRSLEPRLVGHNLKFDLNFMYRNGVDLTDRLYHDTLLMLHLSDENRESYSLDSIVKEMFNDNYKEEFWKKYESYQEAPKDEREDYACRDIMYTDRLYRRLIECVPGKPSINVDLLNHVHRLQRALLHTEISGIKVDEPYLINLGVKVKSQIEQITPLMKEIVRDETEMVEMQLWAKELSKRKTDKGRAGVKRPEFSFESSQQLQALLYDVMGLPIQRNEKTKSISTDYASLEKLREHHPVIGLIQENRELQKVYTAYIQGTLERMQNGRIYPEFRVNGTKTGRISHSNPNLGQLPKSGGIRGIYVPNTNCVFLSADYSQLEVNIEANLTGDRNLARIFNEGLSKHDITAKELGVSRDVAKTLNFALQYWCTHMKVAKLLHVTEKEGYEIWKKYWEIYSGPKTLKARTDGAVDTGEDLVTAFGRRRRFPVRRRSPYDGDYRQAYNFLIQGTGSDLTSRAFYLTSEWLQEKKIGRGLFTVHDELIIEVKADYVVEAEAQMLSFMTQAGDEISLQIPLKAESSGPTLRWED